MTWLEFIPVDDSLAFLLTKTETTQPTREDVVRWSITLTEEGIRGALTRAVSPNELSLRPLRACLEVRWLARASEYASGTAPHSSSRPPSQLSLASVVAGRSNSPTPLQKKP